MRIALGQLEVTPGRPRLNLERALGLLHQAVMDGAALLLFPEMVLPGYLLGDLWDQNAFLREVLDCQNELIRASRKIPIAFGGLQVDWLQKGEDGRPRKYNAYFLAQAGELLRTCNGGTFGVKTLMPNYREFDDSRYFYDSRKLAEERGVATASLVSPYVIEIDRQKIKLGISLCEDAWDADYHLTPLKILSDQSVQLLLNLSASPFTKGKDDKRHRLFQKAAHRYQLPIAYCNAVGIQNNGKTVYSFDGGSCIYYPDGQRSSSLRAFEAGIKVVDTVEMNSGVPKAYNAVTLLKNALEYGTKKFIEQCHCERVVIGVSGGIDSALAATVYSSILPKEQVLLVNMPSRFNSNTTKQAAAKLALNLGCLSTIVDIQQSVDHSIEQFTHLSLKMGDRHVDTTLNCSPLVQDNIQARDRSSRVLAGVAASFAAVFTCNANKSETTVGYSTLYGDHAGFLANLADLWKHEIYALAHEYNQQAGFHIIPKESLDMVPAAELNAAQNPEKGQGDPFCYTYHDALFSKWVEDWQRKTPEDILLWYAEGELAQQLNIEANLISKLFPSAKEFIADLEKWWNCYAGLGVAKRIQAPPILAFSRRAFGFDHREAQLGLMYTKVYLELKKKLLA